MLNLLDRWRRFMHRCRGHAWTLQFADDRMFLVCADCPATTKGWLVPDRVRSLNPLAKDSGGSVEFIISVDERSENSDGVRVTLRHADAARRYDLVLSIHSDAHGGARDLRLGDHFRLVLEQTAGAAVEHAVEEAQRTRLALAED